MIRIELDVMLARRKMTLTELSRRLDIALPNLSILKNGHAKAIRMALLDALCRELDCQPGELLVWEPDDGRKGIIIHRKKGAGLIRLCGKDQPCFCRSGMLLSGAAKKASTNTPPRGSRRKPAVRTAWAYDRQGRSAQALPEFRRVPVGKSCCGQNCSW